VHAQRADSVFQSVRDTDLMSSICLVAVWVMLVFRYHRSY
jgi:hypothetical protein